MCILSFQKFHFEELGLHVQWVPKLNMEDWRQVEELRAVSQQSSVIGHNWMLQGSFNSIFSPANICYSGDGIRTWNEEAVSR
ncbi:hypothetical protein RHMOL_Rhmol04G0032600 [Rhododendron molle]|uniref:Uncharacterized protein n=1 Tax=Rhododendron molle TaxID=49168 RepID=A0ACC0NXQ3_RHOML|nr:hypothetical protein RHMOL_Rhmol04G0032600 [Rhododendron molle]